MSFKDRKLKSLLASICFKVQSGSREDFVGLGPDRDINQGSYAA